VDVTLKPTRYDTIRPAVCRSYTVPSGDETYTNSGTYQDTLQTVKGCDSLLTVDLTIKNPTRDTLTVTRCDSFTLPSGRKTVTKSGQYQDTLTNAVGCDSLVLVKATIQQSVYDTFQADFCHSYTVPSGDETYYDRGQVFDTLPAGNGCQQILVITLNPERPDTAVQRDGQVLKARAEKADYQWLVCRGGSYRLIDGGAQGRSFRAFRTDRYAVEITKAGCADTSRCYWVRNVGKPGRERPQALNVYPNPTGGQFQVQLGQTYEQVKLEIRHLTGKLVKRRRHQNVSEVQGTFQGEGGVYLLRVTLNGANTYNLRLIKR
jgi:hypothetical protein